MLFQTLLEFSNKGSISWAMHVARMERIRIYTNF